MTARVARASIIIAGGLLVVPAFTTSAAFQDMASLAGDAAKAARWQAPVAARAPASAGTAALAALDVDSRDRLPNGSRIRSTDTVAADTIRRVADASPELRIGRTEKGGRVIGRTASAAASPKGFSAGSLLERPSLLSSLELDNDRRVRTAFSKISDKTIDTVSVAMNFQLKGTPKIPAPDAPEAPVMLASVKPAEGNTPALGYAPDQADRSERTSSLFESILKQTPEAFVPPIGEKDHAWAATPLSAAAFSAKEQKCLAEGIYFEARGEPEVGQAAVAQVILNRVRNPAFPNTICGVVYQNKSWRNRCQFSFACDGLNDRIADRKSYMTATRVADQVTKGEIWLREVGSATHYHANYVKPRWASAMERVDRIGKHLFYRTYNGGW